MAKNRTKYKTRNELELFVERYLEHRSKGLSVKCFPDCSYECIKSTKLFLKKHYPDLYEDAMRADRLHVRHWESLNIQAASGRKMNDIDPELPGEKNDTFMNAACIMFALKNCAGWVDDAKDSVSEFTLNTNKPAFEQLNAVKKLRAQGKIQSTQANDLLKMIETELDVKKAEKIEQDFDERLKAIERNDQ